MCVFTAYFGCKVKLNLMLILLRILVKVVVGRDYEAIGPTIDPKTSLVPSPLQYFPVPTTDKSVSGLNMC